MSDVSRVFWLRNPPSDPAHNANTVLARRWPASETPSLRELFLASHPEIRRELSTKSRPGVSLLALDGFGVQATAHLVRKPDALNAAILGRHSDAELALRGDPSLSLRHLALLVPPGGPETPLALRVLDLRTPSGFRDERGRAHRGLELNGPAFLACGRYAVLAVPHDGEEPPRLPEDPLVAWQAFPRREYADDAAPPLRQPQRLPWLHGRSGASERRDRGSSTLIRALPGPRNLDQRLLHPGEQAVGQLVVRSARGSAVVSVGPAALRCGVLLGRDGRCAASELLSSQYISRVHLLVITVAGRIYAVDTASHNGVQEGAVPRRTLCLDAGEAVSLAGEARVEWRFVH